MKSLSLVSSVIPVFFLLITLNSFAIGGYNGFDVSKSLIPKNEIMGGGPPRDGIPAIMKPKFETASKASWLNDGDLIAGVDHNGVQKAYPLRILVWHEGVNDTVGGTPIFMSYCPLCGSTLAYKRHIKGKTLTFKISGLLHQSNVLFYDEQTESLWSQLALKAVAGEMITTPMELFPSTLSTWKEWKAKHPTSLVLTRETGHRRNYDRDPYGNYYKSKSVWFPVNNSDKRFHPKEKILVVVNGNDSKAYPFSELAKVKGTLTDKIGGQDFTIHYNNGDYVAATTSDGKPADSFITFWFAWYTFKPDTPVFTN